MFQKYLNKDKPDILADAIKIRLKTLTNTNDICFRAFTKAATCIKKRTESQNIRVQFV